MTECWSCGAPTDAASSVDLDDDAQPGAGDVSVCMYCGAIAIFTGHGVDKRQPTAKEHDEAMADPRVERAVGAILTAQLLGDIPNRRVQ